MNEQTKPQNINGIHAGVPCVALMRSIYLEQDFAKVSTIAQRGGE